MTLKTQNFILHKQILKHERGGRKVRMRVRDFRNLLISLSVNSKNNPRMNVESAEFPSNIKFQL
jgi:hypothetical protein